MGTLLNAMMLYQAGITEKIHGIAVDWIVVDASEVDDMLADGWYRSPADVKAASDAEKLASAESAKPEVTPDVKTDEATQKPAPKK